MQWPAWSCIVATVQYGYMIRHHGRSGQSLSVCCSITRSRPILIKFQYEIASAGVDEKEPIIAGTMQKADPCFDRRCVCVRSSPLQSSVSL